MTTTTTTTAITVADARRIASNFCDRTGFCLQFTETDGIASGFAVRLAQSMRIELSATAVDILVDQLREFRSESTEPPTRDELLDLRRKFMNDMNPETRALAFREFSDRVDDIAAGFDTAIGRAKSSNSDPFTALGRVAQEYYNIGSDLRDLKRSTPVNEREPLGRGAEIAFRMFDDAWKERELVAPSAK